jgi:type VI secretion system protein
MSLSRLTLSIRNYGSLANGVASRIDLDQRGAVLGRSPTVDWSLPDPRLYVSSRHCEIKYIDDAYHLYDVSTNGTFLNGSDDRMESPHILQEGDVVKVGHYELVATLSVAQALEVEVAPWGTSAPLWDPAPGEEPAPLPKPPAPEAPAPEASAPAGESSGWADPAPAPVADIPAPAVADWPEIAPEPVVPPEQVWGSIEDTNQIEWSKGGYADTPDDRQAEAAPAVAAEVPSEPFERFVHELGVDRAALSGSPEEVLGRGGLLIRRLIAGLVVMIAARARAKSQMGAQSTMFNRDGNNPIKFAATANEAIAQLLNPPVRGFMNAELAIEDSFRDLQAHQMATLKAMQGALRATLDRFSPASIAQRAEKRGIFSRILPGSRDAAMWQAYQREFSGVAEGSDEAFMDVFAQEFRRAYEDQANQWQ